MIVDSHCHAWRYWPYRPDVPDPHSRGTVEQLLFEMDQSGVDRAVVVCARIEHNPDDNDYVAECLRRFPDRLYQFADVDCSWTSTYHTPGAAERLTEAVHTYSLRGFTHYVRGGDEDGAWFSSDDGLAFLRAAADLNQIASFAISARLQPALRQAAARFPSVPFLCHHMAGARVADGMSSPTLAEIRASAAQPNIHVKLSGFHYVGPVAWEYPYPECQPMVRALYEWFGPERLHWGSDYPVLRRAATYRQALEAVRTHCEFISPQDMARILGDSLHDLLLRHGVG
jgi:predicted TIM-barrel fold metal-dependent hydrolase